MNGKTGGYALLVFSFFSFFSFFFLFKVRLSKLQKTKKKKKNQHVAGPAAKLLIEDQKIKKNKKS